MNGAISLEPPPVWVRAAAAFIRHLPAARYRLIARLCTHPPAPFLMRLPEGSGGYSYVCDLNDCMSQEICFTGRFEAQETALFRSILRPGMTVVDVGGNWGYFTLLAAHLVGSGGRVITFEPDPRLHGLLRQNVERNQLRQVIPLEIAAAAAPGTLTLAGYTKESGNYGLSRAVNPARRAADVLPPDTFIVAAKRVDDVLDELGCDAVEILKMDIEGAEDFALRGMEKGLARHRYRRIILELHPTLLTEHGHTAQDAFDRLQADGYRAWRIDHSPATTRRVAYLEKPDLKRLLQPISNTGTLDAWPHLLWLAPGLELPR